jgi:hypothetical protein
VGEICATLWFCTSNGLILWNFVTGTLKTFPLTGLWNFVLCWNPNGHLADRDFLECAPDNGTSFGSNFACVRVYELCIYILLTYLLTYSMVQDIIWKADSHSACQKILFSLWNPKFHYRVHNSPPLDPILSQPNPVRPIDPYLPKVQLNVILPTTPRSIQWCVCVCVCVCVSWYIVSNL